MITNAAFNGVVTIQLEDQNGKIVQEETKQNAATEGFLSWMLGHSLSTAPLAHGVRGHSKTGSTLPGQFISAQNHGVWGIFCMNDAVPVNKNDVFPKYIVGNTYTPNVSFFGCPGQAVAEAGLLIPSDETIVYNKTRDGTRLTIEYTQVAGAGRIRSVHLGRSRANRGTFCGLLLGDPNHQPLSIAGTNHYLLDHQTDTTRVFKWANATNYFWFDLTTKNLAAETTSLALTGTNAIFSTTVAQLMGGALWRDGICYSTNEVALNATTGATVTVRRKALNSLTANAQLGTVIFPDIKTTTTADVVGPILVRRPDNDTFEIFLGQWVSGVGVRLYKSVLSALTNDTTTWGGTFGAPTLVATLTSGGIPSFGPNAGAGNFGVTTGIGDNSGRVSPTGYYDVDSQRYHFPCYRGLTADRTLIDYGNLAVFCPGYVFDSEFKIVDEYLAWSNNMGGVQSFNAPCKTDLGILPVQVNTPQMYMPKVSQVLSGVVFDEPFDKTHEYKLRILYRYQLS